MELRRVLFENVMRSMFTIVCCAYFIINSVLDIISSDWVKDLVEKDHLEFTYGVIVSIIKSFFTGVVLLIFILFGFKC